MQMNPHAVTPSQDGGAHSRGGTSRSVCLPPGFLYLLPEFPQPCGHRGNSVVCPVAPCGLMLPPSAWEQAGLHLEGF